MSLNGDRTARLLLAGLCLSGCTLGLVSMVFPQPPSQDDSRIYLVLLCGFLVGGLLLLAGQRRPKLVIGAGLAGTTLLISAGIEASTEPTSVYALFFVGTAIVAFGVLSPAGALAQVVLVAVSYGVVMLDGDAPGGSERWLVTVGTVLGVGLTVSLMRHRVEALVAELSASVERLAEAANTDALTGLVNRRGFDERVARELSATRRGAPPFALVLCDLDCFKAVNDAVGHPGGDRVLQQVAATLTATVRDVDVVARLGGEEFGVLLPATDEAGALVAADRLRAAIAEAFAFATPRLTASCGVATTAQEPTEEGLLRAADTALYAAKRLGRDRSIAYRAHLPAMLQVTGEDGSRGDSPLRTLLALAEALDFRDPSTALHSVTVADDAEAMAIALGLPAREAARVRLAGLLHDIGKIAVSDAVLRKAGPLDDREWAEMRTHPETGARLLEPTVADVAGWVIAHHERVDGTGYPRGLADAEIPLEAKILAVADAYEAMTADRPYRRAMPREAAARELEACAGTQFDAEVVAAFLGVLERRARAHLVPSA